MQKASAEFSEACLNYCIWLEGLKGSAALQPLDEARRLYLSGLLSGLESCIRVTCSVCLHQICNESLVNLINDCRISAFDLSYPKNHSDGHAG